MESEYVDLRREDEAEQRLVDEGDASMNWNRYDNWSSVLAAARRDGRLYYQAPLDHRPHSVRVVKVFKNKKIRLDPESPDADKFTADRGHLDRFVWLG